MRPKKFAAYSKQSNYLKTGVSSWRYRVYAGPQNKSVRKISLLTTSVICRDATPHPIFSRFCLTRDLGDFTNCTEFRFNKLRSSVPWGRQFFSLRNHSAIHSHAHKCTKWPIDCNYCLPPHTSSCRDATVYLS
jgi:hypothetical protein